ncbi:MAG: EAL domain-containing protein, partial [Actinomycetota bacterium]|nr:EAL domain-containing protein [Actinomycetota bacterium]
RFSIDDFGTGYSSLAYLQKLPVTALKVDKSFVLNMRSSESNTMIVQSTIELGRNLGLQVVAEGVEDRGVWQELDRMHCDYAQGYLLSRPVEAHVLTAMLHSRKSPEGPSEPSSKPALSRWHRNGQHVPQRSLGRPA